MPRETTGAQPATTKKRGDLVETAFGDVRLTVEWGDGMPKLFGKVGSQAFSSVEDERLLAVWSPKGGGEEDEGESGVEEGEKQEEVQSAAEARGREDEGADVENEGQEALEIDESADEDEEGEEGDGADADGEEMDLDSVDEELVSEIERDLGSRGSGAAAHAASEGNPAENQCEGQREVMTTEKWAHVGAEHDTGSGARSLLADGGGQGDGGASRQTDVLVRGLAPRARRDDLHKLFAKCGRIRYIRLLHRKDAHGLLSGKRGSGKVDFAVVEFLEEASVVRALAKNGSLVAGARVLVSVAKSAMPVSNVAGGKAGAGDARNKKVKTSQIRITQVPLGVGQQDVYHWLGQARYVSSVSGPQPMTIKAHGGQRQPGKAM